MKYLKKYKIFESTSITKSELVNKIKYLSTYLHNYMIDYKNLNFYFHYTELSIKDIFDAVDALNEDSPDGFISAISNEFIKWSKIYKNYNFSDTYFDENYETYSDEYKNKNKNELYYQEILFSLYFYVGHTIEQSISNTKWDIPEKKRFSIKDKEFILDALISDYDCDKKYLDYVDYYIDSTYISISPYKGLNNNIVLCYPCLGPDPYNKVDYDCDFVCRLQSYFSGALILDSINTKKIYLPFYY